MSFVIKNWYLFAALVVVLYLIFSGPLMQFMHGIKSVNPAQAVQLMNREGAVVVDVCEVKEFEIGHIPHAINVPLASLKDQLSKLQKHKDKPIVVSCRSGNLSIKAASSLHQQGFARVYLLSGGILAWERDNLPLERT